MWSYAACICSFDTERIPCNETETIRHSTFNNASRLEVCSDGYWNIVCGYGYNILAAVVCRELGHAGKGWQIHKE